MTRSPVGEAPSDQPAKDVPKLRQCLRCRVTFHSAWAGERICSHCKTSNTWRSGTPLRSFATGGRRYGPKKGGGSGEA